MRISDWSSDVCSSDLSRVPERESRHERRVPGPDQDDAGPPARTLHGAGRRSASPPGSRPAMSANASVGPSGTNVRSSPSVSTRHSEPSAERRSEEHTSELQSLMRISYAVFCLKKKITKLVNPNTH